MGKVVRRVDAPGVSGPMVMGVPDAVKGRVAHVDVGMRHVDLGTQDERAVGELPRPHAVEEIEALLDRPVPPGTVPAGFRGRAARWSSLSTQRSSQRSTAG